MPKRVGTSSGRILARHGTARDVAVRGWKYSLRPSENRPSENTAPGPQMRAGGSYLPYLVDLAGQLSTLPAPYDYSSMTTTRTSLSLSPRVIQRPSSTTETATPVAQDRREKGMRRRARYAGRARRCGEREVSIRRLWPTRRGGPAPRRPAPCHWRGVTGCGRYLRRGGRRGWSRGQERECA